MTSSSNPPVCPGEHQILAMLKGVLDSAEQADLLHHITECPECRHLVAVLAKSCDSLFSRMTLVAETAGGPGEAVNAPWRPLPVGTAIDRYVVLRFLGRGGMGAVYRAHDPHLARDVALKIVSKRAQGVELTALLQEARALAKLSHPNVVQVYDAGRADDAIYIAMELVLGVNLNRWLVAGPRSWIDITQLFVQAGRGLAAAHDAQIIHRDFKPQNVMVTSDGRAMVTDFGLAFDASTGPEAGQPSAGTPAYMSPEQRQGEALDVRSDQYSFVRALQDVLRRAGYRAGMENNPNATGARYLPAWLHRIIRRGLESDRGQRFDSMHAVVDALRRDRVRRRNRWLLGAVAVLVLGVGGTLAYLWSTAPYRACVQTKQR